MGSRPFLPNTILAMLPALYAWQIYGFSTGAMVYVSVLLVLAATGWTWMFVGWSFRVHSIVRTALVMMAMIAVGLSATESCDIAGNCRSVWR